MKDRFSTFDIVKFLGINRNTLQSAIAAGFIVPDIQTPSKKDGERAVFSRKGLYRVSLFFKLIQLGRTRFEASMESNIAWDNVGGGQDQLKYLCCAGDITIDPRMKIGGLEACRQMPINEMRHNEAVRLIINLNAIKKEVDERVA